MVPFPSPVILSGSTSEKEDLLYLKDSWRLHIPESSIEDFSESLLMLIRLALYTFNPFPLIAAVCCIPEVFMLEEHQHRKCPVTDLMFYLES